jgi:hypothetical protein
VTKRAAWVLTASHAGEVLGLAQVRRWGEAISATSICSQFTGTF